MPAAEAAATVGPEGTTAAASPDNAKLRFAVKTALSLTLAYLIPMALGWPQPQTAATTVMLIAATGTVTESLQKGVLRILGTLVGAAIGLGLIALFPQDRMLYLLAVSTATAFTIYLYAAYQGDSTVFMLTAVVTLMVFNGGDAEGAFLYGVDRAFMTVIGVMIYTLVGSLLWPVQLADNTRSLARALAASYHSALQRLAAADDDAGQESAQDELLAAQQAFQAHFAAVRGDSERVKSYLAEWDAIDASYQRLEPLLLPSPHAGLAREPDYGRYVNNYSGMLERTEALFALVDRAWDGEAVAEAEAVQLPEFVLEELREATQLERAAVVARAHILEQVQRELAQLAGAVSSMVSHSGSFDPNRKAAPAPAFIWLDGENLRTGLRAFLTFWLATGLWIAFNPPGGFMFVTLSVALVPLVSYTPVTPKMLVILLSLGFTFALPAYIFLLPQMTHWLQLGAFLFAYAFAGFFLFPGPVAIFFLLGLFVLGIQNTMHYDLGILLTVILMFYLVCGLLMVAVNFPFSSKPEVLYRSCRRRFLSNCGDLIARGPALTRWQRWCNRLGLITGQALVAKMQQWGPAIDNRQFSRASGESIAAFTHACEGLQGQLEMLLGSNQRYAHNPLVAGLPGQGRSGNLATLCYTLARTGDDAQINRVFAAGEAKFDRVEEQLGTHLGSDLAATEGRDTLAEFYFYLNRRAALFYSIQRCRQTLQNLDWQQLRDSRLP